MLLLAQVPRLLGRDVHSVVVRQALAVQVAVKDAHLAVARGERVINPRASVGIRER